MFDLTKLRREVPSAEALSFPGAPDDLLARPQTSSDYSQTLRESIAIGSNVIYDPDLALNVDPDVYRKIVTEIAIASKLRKRASRVVAAEWNVRSKDQALAPVCSVISEIMRRIRGFATRLKALSYNATLRGWSTARIFGEYVWTKMPGDSVPRRWWIPTTIVDVGKERWRLHREDPQWIEAGWPSYYWAVQDVLNYQWYRLDGPGAVPGLRRMDYIWAKSSEDEEDLGYAHGLARGILHKWHLLTHNWIYAMDGAESWSKGKVVLTTENQFGGATLPGDSTLASRRAATQYRDEVAAAAANQLSRHVLVLGQGETYDVFGRPESGHESVKWIVETIGEQLDEYILGVRKGENRPWDIDPELINSDKGILEDAINDDLLPVILLFNEWNFADMGYQLDDLVDCRWEMKRDSGFDPETLGKSLQIAQALGVPIHRADVYRGLGLTPVEADSPDAVLTPQPGQPVSGGQVDVSRAGEGPTDWAADHNGAPIPVTTNPAPPGPAQPTDVAELTSVRL